MTTTRDNYTLQLHVTTTSYNYKLQLQVTTTIYDYNLRLQFTTTIYNYKLQLQLQLQIVFYWPGRVAGQPNSALVVEVGTDAGNTGRSHLL